MRSERYIIGGPLEKWLLNFFQKHNSLLALDYFKLLWLLLASLFPFYIFLSHQEGVYLNLRCNYVIRIFNLILFSTKVEDSFRKSTLIRNKMSLATM